jgi:hypothetical protein
MSLVNQFQITLKDFLPELSDGLLITDPRRGTPTAVSGRLYANLKAYVDQYQFSIHAVLEQLRQEIHSQPTAENFAKGDRVRLSAKGVRTMPRMDADRSGTIVAKPREGHCVAVWWDGNIRPRYINPSVLERSHD